MDYPRININAPINANPSPQVNTLMTQLELMGKKNQELHAVLHELDIRLAPIMLEPLPEMDTVFSGGGAVSPALASTISLTQDIDVAIRLVTNILNRLQL